MPETSLDIKQSHEQKILVQNYSELLLSEILGVCISDSIPGISNSDNSSIYYTLNTYLNRYHSDQSALAPSPALNSSLGRLVDLVIKTHSHSDIEKDQEFHNDVVRLVAHHLKDQNLIERSKIIKKCAGIAEGEMEAYYSTLIISSQPHKLSAVDQLSRFRELFKEFPYLDNYISLCHSEATAVDKLIGSPKSILFCGSGPLPLSAILFQIRFGCKVTLVDSDLRAVDLSCELVKLLEQLQVVGKDTIRIVNGLGQDQGFNDYDFVAVASLVSKIDSVDLAKKFALSEGQSKLLMVRTVEDLAMYFCYDKFDHNEITGFGWCACGVVLPERNIGSSELLKFHPSLLAMSDSSVINSTEFFRK